MGAVKLVVSDVDGTLVTSDKRVTDGVSAAVRRLAEAGIAFTVTSSRPPVGLRMLVEPLGLTLPMGAFNGGSIVAPDLTPIEETFIPAPAARTAISLLSDHAVGIWVFARGRWWLSDPDGPHVEHERRTIQADPTTVPDWGSLLDEASKIVGVSDDADHLARCETALQARLAGAASAARSQTYYLDVTPPGVDKGTMVAGMAGRLGIPLDAVATVGDMTNDVPMFERSGVSIAVGNASPAVKARARFATAATNNEDGFAEAIDRFVLAS